MTDNQTTALKPCPFCGKAGRPVELHGDWFVNCDECDYSLRNAATRDRAIERWNERAQ